jgi:hypothetical protein
MMLIKNLGSYKFGRDKTYEMLADNFYWSKMRRDVERLVERREHTCDIFQKHSHQPWI